MAACSRRSTAYRFDANQELLALGAGNLLSGLGRGFPVSGGMSQSLVNESAGARTPLSGLVAALFTLIVVLFASGLLRNLPQPVLAAIVLAAVMSLVDIAALTAHLALQPHGVLRVDRGAARRPRVRAGQRRPARRRHLDRACSFARPHGRAWSSSRAFRARHCSRIVRAIPTPSVQAGLLVVRCESALLYFNVEFVRERVFEMLKRASRTDHGWSSLRSARFRMSIWLEPSSSPISTGRFRARSIAFRVADARGEVRDALRRIGFEREHGPLETGQTVDAVVTAWQARET